MKRSKVIIPVVVIALIAAIAGALLYRKAAPPEPVRLLPGAEAYLYVNATPLRLADIQPSEVHLDPEYENFVKETGFQVERDLDEAAIAAHVPPPGSPATAETRFSEVFVAKFDTTRLRRYLNKLSSRVDSYRDIEVFNIPIENRTVRVAILAPDLVTASNVDDPLVIRGVIDRYKRLASPFAGPKLVRQYYRKLPFGSVAWAIADIARDSKQNKAFVIPGGFDLFFPPDSVAVASVRYLGSIDFKAQVFTQNEESARRVTDQVSAFLALFRSLESNATGSDPDVKKFFDSLKIEQNGSQAILTAELPKGFIKKLLTEPPATPQVTPPPEQPKKPAAKSKAKAKKAPTK
ncbi:MAG TPA: hypothetical protein VN577_16065 [Terriglobales bacterium]|nr:hypothetical protein [Terriglobales bacterium]